MARHQSCVEASNNLAEFLMGSELSRDEKWLARTMFVSRLVKANGQAFQGLFWAIMRAQYGTEFVEVRPQGQRGDGGNDGYLPADGHYFQVYGPVEPSEKIATATKKLTDDFATVMKEWGPTNPVRAYSFVFNDKYEGTFRDIAQALAELEKSNPTIAFRPMTAAHLEDRFMALSADAMSGILNAPIPDAKAIVNLRYDVLNEVVRHIIESPRATTPTRFGELPDLDEKIRLNKISNAWADIIRAGARQAGHLDAYFAKNSRFAKQQLRDHMIEHYRLAAESVRLQSTGPIPLSDAVFVDFRDRLTPKEATFPVVTAVDILIGYYFEACDVFDPFAVGTTNASP